MKTRKKEIMAVTCLLLLFSSCLRHGSLYEGTDDDRDTPKMPLYIYPFSKENQGVTAELTVKVRQHTDLSRVQVVIPHLKYNKSWLFVLTQDDCKHAAYSCTFAAINGRPLTKKYFYDVRQYMNDDLPLDTYYLSKTLGSTDGAGNKIRFSFTTTLAPEWDFMNAMTTVSPVFSQNYYRFFMKSGLIWDNVVDMVNYGTGIAFHDVNTKAVNTIDSIVLHYTYSQDSILNHLSGRGCKMLAEPNGNKTYVTAARHYAPVQVMTAQEQAVKLYPFKVEDDLQGQLLNRMFSGVSDTKKFILTQLQLPKEEREAVCVGVHGTATDWVDFLVWLNDQYGKDGDDSMWFTSLEEYYEYNYYRIHGSIEKTIENENTLKLKVNLPAGEYFYYPSVTVNLEGLEKSDVLSVSGSNTVKGLSVGGYNEGTMLNIDCRKWLVEHATHFVEEYEKNPTEITRRDALYFVALLKDSSQKEALQKRIK